MTAERVRIREVTPVRQIAGETTIMPTITDASQVPAHLREQILQEKIAEQQREIAKLQRTILDWGQKPALREQRDYASVVGEIRVQLSATTDANQVIAALHTAMSALVDRFGQPSASFSVGVQEAHSNVIEQRIASKRAAQSATQMLETYRTPEGRKALMESWRMDARAQQSAPTPPAGNPAHPYTSDEALTALKENWGF